jgi:short-subunit dehydrogenase
MYSLLGKVVVITGGSSGIGKALVETALQRGAKVATCGRNLQKLAQVWPAQNNLLLFEADVSKEQDCHAFIQAVLNKWNTVDVLINNAGISMRALFAEVDLAVLRELMDVNFWGMVYCTKFALPYIQKQVGAVVGISSIAGYRGLPCRTGYSASKFAMQGFLEALRTELLHTGVRVLWVSPGFTASNIRNTARSKDGTPQKETPLDEGKLMSAEECARQILNGIEQDKRTIVMTRQGKLTVLLNKFFPSLTDKMVFKHFLKEPDSPLKKTN